MTTLGCSTLGFRFDSLDTALQEIAGQGFRLVDIAMYPGYCPHFNPATASAADIDALQSTLSELGLGIATLNAGNGRLGDASSRQREIDYIRSALALAQRLGARGVTMQSGVEPASGHWHDVAMTVAPDVRSLGDEARERGLELTLELHKSLLMATGQQALDLMELIDHPQVGVALDPSHATHAGENVAKTALKLGGLVKHVHLRDAIGKNILVVPGDGDVDFSELARALRTIGYTRAPVIELEYEHATADEVRPDLARAKSFLEDAFATA